MKAQMFFVMGLYYFIIKVVIVAINCSPLNIKVPRKFEKFSYGMIGFFVTQAFGIFS